MGIADGKQAGTVRAPPTVLVIEPDAALQTLFVDILQSAGYDVVTAVHHDNLHRILEEAGPGMALIAGGRRGGFTEGWRTAARLKAIAPDLPLIMVTTNYAAVAEVGQTPRGRLFTAAVRKPFRLDDLIGTITRVRGTGGERGSGGDVEPG